MKRAMNFERNVYRGWFLTIESDEASKNIKMVWVSGFEPLTSTMSTWRSDQLSYTHTRDYLFIHGAGSGTRTHTGKNVPTGF